MRQLPQGWELNTEDYHYNHWLSMQETKQTLGSAILTLVKKVKSLEVALKRKTKRVVVSDLEDEETEAQGRKIQELDDDPLVSLVKDFVTPTNTKIASKEELKAEVILASNEFNTGSIRINTGNEDFSTGSLGVSTSTGPVSTPSVVIIPSPIKGQREGKAPMTTEDIQATKRTKVQIQQEEAGLIEAIRLQTLQEEEAARQVYLDALLAKRISEEEELSEQQKKRKAEVQEDAQHYTEEDWDTIRAKLEANAELTKSYQRRKKTGERFSKRIVEMNN
ncbi:hypothetical protein Tco_0910093 [Tanacetum coccineum]|uniref:Uncharacterized protein n=1 Tax=Tanacetum coccineum TaxID=301880 RepID=A0ABQ5CV78_9ASTR